MRVYTCRCKEGVYTCYCLNGCSCYNLRTMNTPLFVVARAYYTQEAVVLILTEQLLSPDFIFLL